MTEKKANVNLLNDAQYLHDNKDTSHRTKPTRTPNGDVFLYNSTHSDRALQRYQWHPPGSLGDALCQVWLLVGEMSDRSVVSSAQRGPWRRREG